ncbi:MAG: ribonuclease Z [Nanoarchaeota archaeon]
MELVFLGTSAMVPTKERNHSALFIKYGKEGILVDCGEGTQRQFKLADESATKVTKILISHWHGDHVLGLPGLLQTLSASEYGTKETPLEIYGPKGTKKHIGLMLQAFPFDNKLDIKIKEITDGIFISTDDFEIEAYELDHSTQCIGFKFREKDKRRIDVTKVKKIGIPEGPLLGKLQQNKAITFNGKKISPKDTTYVVAGKVIGIIADTGQCKNCLEIAEGTDILICEATFMESEVEKAEQYKHLTIKQSALIAHTSNTKKLILTHFSQRYKDKAEIEQEAKDIFSDVTLAYDGMKIQI